MSKNNNHIEQLTPEILRLYHAGKLNAEQMHQVEKLMLDDPFYTDALEGFDEFSAEIIDGDLSALNGRLDEMLVESKPTIWLHWRKLAAAVILIGVCTSIFLLTQDKAPLPTKELTENKKASPEDSTEVEAQQPNAAKIDTTKTEAAPTQLLASEKAPIELNESEDEISLTLDIDVTEEALVEIIFEEEVGEVVATQAAAENEKAALKMRADSMLRGRVSGVAIESAAKTQSAAAPAPPLTQDLALTPNRTVMGQIVDETGLGLPGVNILKKGSTEVTISNTDGQFHLNQSDSTATYVVSYLGYTTQEFSLSDKTSDTLKIQLEPDIQALGEVVVSGIGNQDESEIKAKEAEPTIGYKEFQQYIKDNLRYPEAAKANNIRGRVVVSFTVEPSGELTNITIEKSLGFGCDEEALRLIEEGPSWNAKIRTGSERVPSKVKVRIRFRP